MYVNGTDSCMFTNTGVKCRRNDYHLEFDGKLNNYKVTCWIIYLHENNHISLQTYHSIVIVVTTTSKNLRNQSENFCKNRE